MAFDDSVNLLSAAFHCFAEYSSLEGLNRVAWDVAARAGIVELHFRTGSIVWAQRAFRRERGCRVAPDKRTVRRLVKRFQSEGSVLSKPQAPRGPRHAENVATVRRAVRRNPRDNRAESM